MPKGTTYTQDVTPAYLSQPLPGTAASAGQLYNRPFQGYTGERVAEFSPTQQQGFDMVRESAGAYKPWLEAAAGTTMGALEAAMPFLQRAGQSSIANIGEYMNPYMQQVIDRFGEMGARTLREQLIPSIRDKYIMAGQAGPSSGRNVEQIRALRDVQEAVGKQQAEMMMQGWKEAAGLAQSDLGRYLQLGSTLGNLYTGVGSNLADLAAKYQGLGLSGAQALMGVGEQERARQQALLDVNLERFREEQAYPQERLSQYLQNLANIKSIAPSASVSYQTSKGPKTSAYQAVSGLSLIKAGADRGSGATGGK